MQMAYDRHDAGTAIVKCAPASDLKLACQKAKEYCKNVKGIDEPECALAGYLYPSHKLVSGHNEALLYLKENVKKFGLIKVRKARLPGGHHSKLMNPVVQPFTEALKSLEIKNPIIYVHSNVDGQRYYNAKDVLEKLPKQV